MSAIDLSDVGGLASVLSSLAGLDFCVDRFHNHGLFVGGDVDFRHGVSPVCGMHDGNMEDEMALVKRVKQAVKDYFALDKNVRISPDGEVVPRRDGRGRELLDPVPVAPPVGWFKQPSMFDQVRDMVRGEHLRIYAESQGAETFDDANDFDVEDDMHPISPYEADFEPLQDLQARRQSEFREQFLKEREERYIKRKRREWQAEDDVVRSSPAKALPPEPRPSPAVGAGDGGRQPAPGERSSAS